MTRVDELNMLEFNEDQLELIYRNKMSRSNIGLAKYIFSSQKMMNGGAASGGKQGESYNMN